MITLFGLKGSLHAKLARNIVVALLCAAAAGGGRWLQAAAARHQRGGGGKATRGEDCVKVEEVDSKGEQGFDKWLLLFPLRNIKKWFC